MNRTRTGLFWGIALITLGVIFMGQNYGWFDIDWSFFSRFWPILIILAGLNLIFARRNASAALVTTVLLAVSVPLAIVGAFRGNRWNHWDNDRYEYYEGDDDDDHNRGSNNDDDEDRDGDRPKVQTSHIAEPMDSVIQQATLKFESGAGRFYIGSSSDSLISADTRMSVSKYSMSVNRSNESRTADIELKLDDDEIDLKSGELVNLVDLRLNAKPTWSFDFGIGAGQANFDLSAYAVRSLKLGAGAADVEVKLGDRAPQTDIKIESGVTAVTLKVPKTVGCQVETQSALTVKKLEGFDNIGGGVYQTPGYGSTTRKILIRYEGGVSKFEVERY